MPSYILFGLLAVASARFDQERVPIPAIQALTAGSPGVAQTIAGDAVSDLLAGANPCAKLQRGDQMIQELGTSADVVSAAIGMVAAEKNVNPFAATQPSICNDPTLPASEQLRGITPKVDPAFAGADIANALSAQTVATPLDATGKSVADLLIENGFTQFTGQAAAGNAAAGADAANASTVNQASDNATVVVGVADVATATTAAAAIVTDQCAAQVAAALASASAAQGAVASQVVAANGTIGAGKKGNGKTKDTTGKGKDNGKGKNNGKGNAGADAAAAANTTATSVAAAADTVVATDSAAAAAATDAVAAATETAITAVTTAAAAVTAAATDAAANNNAAATGGADFGDCDPTMQFTGGLGGRPATEFTFQSNDPKIIAVQQEALNPNIITNRICDSLTNICNANAAAKTICTDAKAQILALGTRDVTTKDAWNKLVAVGSAAGDGAAPAAKRTVRRWAA